MVWRITPTFTQWTPSNITTALWLDAADSTTITESGGLVSQINDKSGNGRNFTASGTARPTLTSNGLNGRNVLTFSGSQWLTSANAASTWNFMHNSTGCTIVAAVRVGTSGDPNALYSILGNNAATSANVGIYLGYDDRSSVPRNNAFLSSVFKGELAVNVSLNLVSNVWTPNQYAVIVNKLDNGNSTVSLRNIGRINGGSDIAGNIDSASPVTSNASFPLQIGAHGNSAAAAVMTLLELIVISGIASTDSIQKSEGYLAHKWGLAASLPTNHPFRYQVPTPGS